MFVDEAKDHKTLHRIDAVCKAAGDASTTHPAIPAVEYARLVEDTDDVLRHGSRRRRESRMEREA